ncbi:hypothetical protein NFI96_025886, partial [Prochilodus magdalenae]
DPPDLRIFSEVQSCNIRAGGHCGNYKFSNTCVLDSLLVALHICYCTYGPIRDLFRSDRRMNVLMAFLNAGQYDKAKAYWLINVNLILNEWRFDMNGLVDVWSEVKDHLPMFEELVYAQYYFDEDRSSPAFSIFEELHQKTLRIFQEFGDVKLLGLSYRDPHLVLIHVDGRLDSELPHFIDAYGRTYNLQSVLFSKMTEEVNHMVCCNKVLDRWILYDDNPEKSSFSDFNIQHADFKNEYAIHLAVYVKSDEENYGYVNDEVPFGVPEDGGSVLGARPYFEDIYVEGMYSHRQRNSCTNSCTQKESTDRNKTWWVGLTL